MKLELWFKNVKSQPQKNPVGNYLQGEKKSYSGGKLILKIFRRLKKSEERYMIKLFL